MNVHLHEQRDTVKGLGVGEVVRGRKGVGCRDVGLRKVHLHGRDTLKAGGGGGMGEVLDGALGVLSRRNKLKEVVVAVVGGGGGFGGVGTGYYGGCRLETH